MEENDIVIPWRDSIIYAIKLGEVLQGADCPANAEESVRELQQRLLGRYGESPEV